MSAFAFRLGWLFPALSYGAVPYVAFLIALSGRIQCRWARSAADEWDLELPSALRTAGTRCCHALMESRTGEAGFTAPHAPYFIAEAWAPLPGPLRDWKHPMHGTQYRRSSYPHLGQGPPAVTGVFGNLHIYLVISLCTIFILSSYLGWCCQGIIFF